MRRTSDDLAAYLGIPVSTVRDWRAAGKGPCGVWAGKHLLSSTDLLGIIYAIAQSWQLSPAGLISSDGSRDDDTDLTTRKSAAAAAVSRLLATTSSHEEHTA